jgi:hypothetical protein
MRWLIAVATSLLVIMALPKAARAQNDVPPVIAKFKEKDPGMEKIFADAVGYAVFPTVGKGGIGIGGARGKGWVYQGAVVVGHRAHRAGLGRPGLSQRRRHRHHG